MCTCETKCTCQVPRSDLKDEGNKARFTLSIDSPVAQPTLGQNITLNVTLHRSGNGSETPGSIQFQLGLQRNITWAFNHVTSPKEYDSLVTSGNDHEDDDYGFQRTRERAEILKVLMTPDMEKLERNRERDEERRGGGCVRMISYCGFRGDDGPSTQSFWDEEPQKSYHFTITFPL